MKIEIKEAASKTQYQNEFKKFYKKRVRLQNDVIKATSRKMKTFRANIVNRIHNAGTETAKWNYKRLLAEFDEATFEFFEKYKKELKTGLNKSGWMGMDKVAKPMQLIGIEVPSITGLINDFIRAETISTMRYVDALKGDVMDLMRNELQVTIAGGQTAFEFQQVIARNYLNPKYYIIEKNGVQFIKTVGVNWRAEMISRTEIARVYQAVGHKGALEVETKYKNDFLKRWVTSGTGPVDSGGRTRLTHWDEQARTSSGIGIKEKYMPGGFPCDFPLDPSLPAAESIMCMCESMIISKEW